MVFVIRVSKPVSSPLRLSAAGWVILAYTSSVWNRETDNARIGVSMILMLLALIMMTIMMTWFLTRQSCMQILNLGEIFL